MEKNVDVILSDNVVKKEKKNPFPYLLTAVHYTFQRKDECTIAATKKFQPMLFQIAKMFERFGAREVGRWEYTVNTHGRDLKALAIRLRIENDGKHA
ncbi:MAG: hypothetical protein J7K87_03035 [Candidatus Aenigmarchaeota archaeon]|nr:hypothetical protein [Candidatus Aenigmarchaeota archaeon]